MDLKHKYIANIAFIGEASLRADLWQWIDSEAAALVAIAPKRRLEVVAIESDPDFCQQAVNLSLQYEFDSLKEAEKFVADNSPAMRALAFETYGEQLMVFATILKSVK